MGATLSVLALAAMVFAQGQSTSQTKPPTAVDATQVQRVDSFSKQLAWNHLVKQVNIGPRYPGSDGHLKCRDWIVEEMKKVAQDTATQEFTHKWSKGPTKTMWNVTATQGWKDAKVRIVVLAHWDTRPTADYDPVPANQGKPILGANDGASGVAVLVELARVMQFRRPKDLGIMYLFTDGEDLGPSLDEMFLGAKHFVKNLPSPRPDYGILLDMIGDKDLKIPVEPNSLSYARELTLAFFNLAKVRGFGSTFPMEEGPIIEDDHIPLNQAGIPTLDLIDFDYEPWHTLGDTIDKCSADSLGKVGDMMVEWLVQSPPFQPKKR